MIALAGAIWEKPSQNLYHYHFQKLLFSVGNFKTSSNVGSRPSRILCTDGMYTYTADHV